MRKNRTLGAIVTVLILAIWLIPSVDAQPPKPGLAVIKFKNKTASQFWDRGGAEVAQDVFVTALTKTGRFRVIGRDQLEALLEQNRITLSGEISPATAIRVGRLLGVRYLLTGTVTEYGTIVQPPRGGTAGKAKLIGAVNGRLIDTSTGEIVWADEANAEDTIVKVSSGGGSDDQRIFDKVMKPCILKLSASLKSADL